MLDLIANTIEHLPISNIDKFETRSDPFPSWVRECQQHSIANIRPLDLMMLRHSTLTQ